MVLGVPNAPWREVLEFDRTQRWREPPAYLHTGQGNDTNHFTIMFTKSLSILTVSLVASMSADAGTESYGKTPMAPPMDAPDPSYTSFCDFFETGGTLYSNSEHPLIQEFKIFGRLQYQLSTLDGEDSFGDDVGYDTDEFRRTRFGASMKLLKHLKISAEFEDVVVDNVPRGGDRDLDLAQLWHAYAVLDLKGAFQLSGVDGLKIGYGRREVNVAEEWNVSSKKIRTIERSAIANKIWPHDNLFSNPVGLWLEGEQGLLAWEVGVFSTTTDEWFAGWDDGQLYYINLQYDFSDRTGLEGSDLILAGFYQDADLDEERLAGGVEWASSLGLRFAQDRWALALNGVVGDNGEQSNPAREGTFWGVVVSPSYWLIKDRLEGVLQYQYQGSEEDQGVRINSRYVRRAASTGDAVLINGGRGDEHHSFYAGLSYYICGHHLKLMGGVEYNDISSDGTQVFEGWMGHLGLRTYF